MRGFQPHLTVAAVVERDGRFLLVEEFVDGALVLNQPAGHVEDGETLVAAVRRETREETGWAFEPTQVLGVYRWRNPDSGETFIRVAFRGELVEQVHDGPTDPDIRAVRWSTPDRVRDGGVALRSPLVVQCIEDHLAGCGHPLTVLVDLSG